MILIIDRTAGTNIGDITLGGGLAVVFDGITSQAQAASASKGSAGYVGKTLTGPKIFGQAIVYGSNDAGYSGTNPAMTINIRGKNGAAPSSRTDGTIVGTIAFNDSFDESIGRQINSTDTTAAWDHLFVDISAGAGSLYCAELEMWELQ